MAELVCVSDTDVDDEESLGIKVMSLSLFDTGLVYTSHGDYVPVAWMMDSIIDAMQSMKKALPEEQTAEAFDKAMHDALVKTNKTKH